MVASGGSAVEPIVATAGAAESLTLATAPAEPRPRPKPGILRLDISKPRRSSGGSVDFRCVSGAAGGGAAGGTGGGGGNGSSSAQATGASSEVSEHDLVDTRECLRFVAGHVQTSIEYPAPGQAGANRANLLIYDRL